MTDSAPIPMDEISTLWTGGPTLRSGLGDDWYSIRPIASWEKLARLGRSNVEALLEKARRRATYVADRYALDDAIRILEALRDRLPEQPRKPLLIGLRPIGYYKPGVAVMVHIGTMPDLLVDGDWVRGVVTEDQEYALQYRTKIRIHGKPHMEGFGGNFGRTAAIAMTVPDFDGMVEAARTDPDFFALWCATVDWEGKPLTAEAFQTALAAPVLVTPKRLL